MTFENLLTPEGIIAGLALVNRLVAVLKSAWPTLDQRVSGALLAFVLSGVLYVLTFAIVWAGDPNLILTTLSAWLGVAAGAIGIDSAVKHVQLLPTKQAASNDAIPSEEDADPPVDEHVAGG